MKKIFIVIIIFIDFNLGISQVATTNSQVLYGVIQKQDLLKPSFDAWFNPGYDNYHADSVVLSKLKGIISKDISIQVFLGTWCGDSKREVPRLLKILDMLSFPTKNLQLVGLGGSDSLIKQSPQHEEAGKGIFRVPTIIVYRNGIELNRINEFAALSLEKDLYAILSRETYSSNYKSFSFVRGWLEDGTLLNKNISARSLASQLRYLTEGESELNNLASLLLKQGKKEEALKIFKVNYNLYPESARVVSSLGEAYYKTGDAKNAIVYLEKTLELNKDSRMIKEILAMLYEAKSLE